MSNANASKPSKAAVVVSKSGPFIGIDAAATDLTASDQRMFANTSAELAARVTTIHNLVALNPGVTLTAGAGKEPGLFDTLLGKVPSGAYSNSSLSRYKDVGAIIVGAGQAITVDTARAVYPLTESGMTKAKAAIKALGPVKSESDLVAEVATAIKANPKPSKAVTAPAATTAADVDDSPLSVEAFTQSVRDLLDKVTDDDKAAAVESLIAIIEAFAPASN